MGACEGRRVAVLVGDEYEDLELWYPALRLMAAGAEVVLAGQNAGRTYRGKHGYPCTSDAAIVDLRPADFDAVVIPGGWMPDRLRRDPLVLDFVRALAAERRPVAAICHGPSILISAGLCAGLRATSSPGIRDDLINAGAEWVDEPTVLDRDILTARRPADLPAFGERLVELVAAVPARPG